MERTTATKLRLVQGATGKLSTALLRTRVITMILNHSNYVDFTYNT